MNSLIKKFLTGLRTDLKGTIVKTLLYVSRVVKESVADGCYHVISIILLPMPARTLTRLKHSLSPTTRLDYADAIINMQADSLIDVYRAHACEKEPETVDWIRTHFRDGDVFYDVGANVGAYSLVACAHNKGNGVVHAFEPSFSTYDQLCRNIILNGWQKNIIPHMIGLTDNTGVAMFNYQSLEAGSANHGLSPASSASTSPGFVYTQQILVFSIDYLINNFEFPVPNLIKLDVDGAEVGVLRGAKETLRNNKLKSILVEVRDIDGMSNQVDELLIAAGFHLVSKTDRGDHITWNCIYARDNLSTSSL